MIGQVFIVILLLVSFFKGESVMTVGLFISSLIYQELYTIRKSLEEKKND